MVLREERIGGVMVWYWEVIVVEYVVTDNVEYVV